MNTTSSKVERNSPNAVAGQRIRALRRMMGLSQSDLAEKIDVTYQQLQKYESGQNNINLNMLYRISEALEESPKKLLLEITEPDSENEDVHMVNQINSRIIKRLTEINDASISASVLKLLDSLVKSSS
jgi:transcriptional regulator with XRE-family HTH domain